jgi:hypothetical protein
MQRGGTLYGAPHPGYDAMRVRRVDMRGNRQVNGALIPALAPDRGMACCEPRNRRTSDCRQPGFRTMNERFIKLAVALTLAGMATSADAAIWAWGCRGKLGNDEVVFNRNTLAVISGHGAKQPLKAMVQREEPVEEKVDAVRFNADDNNGGFEKTMTFTQQDSEKTKLTLTEKSSRKTSDRTGRVGPRDEIWTTWTKVYRYALDGEPPRDITMECGEYTLTTKGGRR